MNMNIYLKLFLMFLKIGLTSFGGGYGMMSMIMDEGARQVGLTAAEFADMTALDLVAPGVVAINGATYIGYIKGGVFGSVCATFGVILPTFVVSVLVLYLLRAFQENKIVNGLFRGIRPACIGLLFNTMLTLLSDIFFKTESITAIKSVTLSKDLIVCLFLFIGSLYLQFRNKTDPLLLTLVGAVVGIVFLR